MGILVFLDELLFSGLILFIVLFFDLLLGEQIAEGDSWYIVCISNLVKVFEFKYFIFRFVSTLGDKNAFCTSVMVFGAWSGYSQII